MRKTGFIAAALMVAACSSGSETAGTSSPEVQLPDATPQQVRAFHGLEESTGRAWTWMQNANFKTPMHLSAPRVGAPTLKAGLAVEAVTKTFLADHKDLFKMRDPSRELVLERSEVDSIAMTHARFQQQVRGVPVVGAELMVHYDKAGVLTSLDATYVPDLDTLDVQPALDAKVVTASVKSEIAKDLKLADDTKLSATDGKLVVFALGDGAPALAYQVTVRAIFGDDPAIWVTTVDAKTGLVLDRYNNLQTIQGSGTGVLGDTKAIQITSQGGGFSLVDTSRGVTISTHSSDSQQVTAEQGANVVTSSSTTNWDNVNPGAGAAVDAHFNAGVVYDYYKKVHNRNGIDDAGGAMLSSAHFGQAYDNAFWDGSSMSYGDGGQLFKPLSAGLDVCAHEFTHGVTERTSALQYQGQPGALNEAVSDIFGAFIEHSVKPDPVNNWKMGELIATAGGPLRDFKNPSVGQQPDNMSRFVQTQQDNGGVHINSGIVNNAAYLMTMGGKNPTSGNGPQFGIGWDKAEQLWYRTNTKYLTSSANFAAAAQATMQAAKDLNLTANEQNIVDCAWKATGVVQGSCSTIVDPQSTTPTLPSGTTQTGDTTSDPTGTSSASDPSTGDTSSSTPSTTKRRRVLVTTDSGGCNVGARGDTDFGPLAGLLAAILGLALGRRRRA
jgi:bacillolysin